MNSEEHQKHPATDIRRRERARSTSCSSITSQLSTASWLPKKVYEASPAEVVQGDLQAYGSFTTTAPAVLWLRSCLNIPISSNSRRKRRETDWFDEYNYEHIGSSRSSSRGPQRLSISRSSSIASSLGEHPTSASSSHDSPPASPLGVSTVLHPILEAVENASKLSYQTVCVTCLKTGKDFPRCPRCGDMWCSRECRMQGGKRHVCRR